MAEFHFRDDATGVCVQTLRVTHNERSDDEVLADLQKNAPAGRTVIALAGSDHVCATPTPTAEEVARESKLERLTELRAKGWANLTDAEKAEARSLAFDLGQWAPA